jgi:hypothetical protein
MKTLRIAGYFRALAALLALLFATFLLAAFLLKLTSCSRVPLD